MRARESVAHAHALHSHPLSSPLAILLKTLSLAPGSSCLLALLHPVSSRSKIMAHTPAAAASGSAPHSDPTAAKNLVLAIAPADGKAPQVKQLAKRVEKILEGALDYGEPRKLPPHYLGVSPLNRQFSVQHVHQGILASFKDYGHSQMRTQIGICVQHKAGSKTLAELRKHNEQLSDCSPLFPRHAAERMDYECLASTHYNVALRLVSSSAQSPVGDLTQMRLNDESLAQVAADGHRWIVLDGAKVSDNDKRDICSWMNASQNQDQAVTDGELLRLALACIEDLAAEKHKSHPGKTKHDLPVAQLVSAVCFRCPMPLNKSIVSSYALFVGAYAKEGRLDLVHELLAFWTSHVDPKRICIPHKLWGALAEAKSLAGRPLLRT